MGNKFFDQFMRLKEKYHITSDFEEDDDEYDDDYNWSGQPAGCRACGNPNWPDCEDSCPMYDD